MAKAKKDPTDDDLRFDDDFDDQGMDNWDSDFDSIDLGGDEDDDPDGRKPISATKAIAKNMGHMASSVASGVATGIGAKVAKALPDADSFANDISEIMSEADRTYDHALKQFRPVVKQYKQAGRQALKLVGDMLPTPLYNRLDKLLEIEESETKGAEDPRDMRENALKTSLDNIFSAQLAITKDQDKRSAINRLIDTKRDRTQHLESMGAMTDIRNQLVFQTAFTRSTYTAYLKKDLELKYRHLYISEDILAATKVMATSMEQKLAAIVKNTSLPETQKIRILERVKNNFKEKTANNVSDYISNFISRGFNKAREAITEGAETAGTLGDAFSTMLEMMNDEAEMEGVTRTRMGNIGKFVGTILGGIGGKKLINKLPQDLLRTVKNFSATAKAKAVMAFNRKLDDFDDTSEILNFFGDKLDKSGKLNISYRDGLYEDGAITNKFIKTVEDIIPNYLSMQTAYLERMSNSSMFSDAPAAKRMLMNWDTGQLEREDELYQKLYAKAFGSDESKIAQVSGIAKELRSELHRQRKAKLGPGATDDQVDLADYKELEVEMSRVISNIALSNEYINMDVGTLRNIMYGNDPENKWSKIAFRGVTHKQQVAQLFMEMITEDNGQRVKTDSLLELDNYILKFATNVGKGVLSSSAGVWKEYGTFGFLNKDFRQDKYGQVYLTKENYTERLDYYDHITDKTGLDNWGNKIEVTDSSRLAKGLLNVGKDAYKASKDFLGDLIPNANEWLRDFAKKHGKGKEYDEFVQDVIKISNKVKKHYNTAANSVKNVYNDLSSKSRKFIYDHLYEVEAFRPILELAYNSEGQPRENISYADIAKCANAYPAAFAILRKMAYPKTDGLISNSWYMFLPHKLRVVAKAPSNIYDAVKHMSRDYQDEALEAYFIDREGKLAELKISAPDMAFAKQEEAKLHAILRRRAEEGKRDTNSYFDAKFDIDKVPTELLYMFDQETWSKYTRNQKYDLVEKHANEQIASVRNGLDTAPEDLYSADSMQKAFDKNKSRFVYDKAENIIPDRLKGKWDKLSDREKKKHLIQAPGAKGYAEQEAKRKSISEQIKKDPSLKMPPEVAKLYTQEEWIKLSKQKRNEIRLHLAWIRDGKPGADQNKLNNGRVNIDIGKATKFAKLLEEANGRDALNEQREAASAANRIKVASESSFISELILKTFVNERGETVSVNYGNWDDMHVNDKLAAVYQNRFELMDQLDEEHARYLTTFIRLYENYGSVSSQLEAIDKAFGTNIRKITPREELKSVAERAKEVADEYTKKEFTEEIKQEPVDLKSRYSKDAKGKTKELIQKYFPEITDEAYAKLNTLERQNLLSQAKAKANVNKHAEGGMIDRHTGERIGTINSPHVIAGGRAMAGEHGPETIVPLNRTRGARAAYAQAKAYHEGGMTPADIYSGDQFKRFAGGGSILLPSYLNNIFTQDRWEALSEKDRKYYRKAGAMRKMNATNVRVSKTHAKLQDIATSKLKLTGETAAWLNKALTISDETYAKAKSTAVQLMTDIKSKITNFIDEFTEDPIRYINKLKNYITNAYNTIKQEGVLAQLPEVEQLAILSLYGYMQGTFTADELTQEELGDSVLWPLISLAKKKDHLIAKVKEVKDKVVATGKRGWDALKDGAGWVKGKMSTAWTNLQEGLAGVGDLFASSMYAEVDGAKLSLADISAKQLAIQEAMLYQMQTGIVWSDKVKYVTSNRDKPVRGTLGFAKAAFKAGWGGVKWQFKNASRALKGILINSATDVYLKPPKGVPITNEDLLLSVEDFKKGVYFDPNHQKLVKSVQDINAPIWDASGRPLITEEHLARGLVDYQGYPIRGKIGAFARGIHNSVGWAKDKSLGLVKGAWDRFLKLKPVKAVATIVGGAINLTKTIFKKWTDIYRADRAGKDDQPLVIARDFADGRLEYVDGTEIKSSYDINKPVIWKNVPENGEQAGQTAISWPDIRAGLLDGDRKPLRRLSSRLGTMIGKAGRWLSMLGLNAATGGAKILSGAVMLAGALLSKGLEKKNPYVDVFIKGVSKPGDPALQGEGIRQHRYFYLDGKPVLSAYGIKGAVIDGETKNVLIKEDQINDLVDFNGKPLTKFAGRSLLGKLGMIALGGTIGAIKHTGRFLGKLGKAALGGLKKVGGGIGSVFKGLMNQGSQALGYVNGFFQNIFETIWNNQTVNKTDLETIVGRRLDRQYALLAAKLGYTTGMPENGQIPGINPVEIGASTGPDGTMLALPPGTGADNIYPDGKSKPNEVLTKSNEKRGWRATLRSWWNDTKEPSDGANIADLKAELADYKSGVKGKMTQGLLNLFGPKQIHGINGNIPMKPLTVPWNLRDDYTQEQWDALDDKQKHYRVNQKIDEDKSKGNWFTNLFKRNKKERAEDKKNADERSEKEINAGEKNTDRIVGAVERLIDIQMGGDGTGSKFSLADKHNKENRKKQKEKAAEDKKKNSAWAKAKEWMKRKARGRFGKKMFSGLMDKLSDKLAMQAGKQGLMALLRSPHVLGAIGGTIAAVAAGFGIYKLWDWFTDSTEEKFDKLRLTFYGVDEDYDDEIKEMEKTIADIRKGKREELNDKELEDFAVELDFVDEGWFFGMFGGDNTDKVKAKMNYFATWYAKRFRPMCDMASRIINPVIGADPNDVVDPNKFPTDKKAEAELIYSVRGKWQEYLRSDSMLEHLKPDEKSYEEFLKKQGADKYIDKNKDKKPNEPSNVAKLENADAKKALADANRANTHGNENDPDAKIKSDTQKLQDLANKARQESNAPKYNGNTPTVAGANRGLTLNEIVRQASENHEGKETLGYPGKDGPDDSSADNTVYNYGGDVPQANLNQADAEAIQSVINQYLAVMRRNAAIAGPNGYSQDYRMGKRHFDCSSFVMRALKEVGFPVSGGETTRSMSEPLKKAGFKYYGGRMMGPIPSDLKPGDIIWRPGHVETFTGGRRSIGAHSTASGVSERNHWEGYKFIGFFRLSDLGPLKSNLGKTGRGLVQNIDQQKQQQGTTVPPNQPNTNPAIKNNVEQSNKNGTAVKGGDNNLGQYAQSQQRDYKQGLIDRDDIPSSAIYGPEGPEQRVSSVIVPVVDYTLEDISRSQLTELSQIRGILTQMLEASGVKVDPRVVSGTASRTISSTPKAPTASPMLPNNTTSTPVPRTPPKPMTVKPLTKPIDTRKRMMV